MIRRVSFPIQMVITLGILLAYGAGLPAATPTVKQALQLKPMQPDIEYDIPIGEDADACQIRAEKSDSDTAWVVRDAGGNLLRQFVDSNGDNKIDQWRYFQNGVEVYRDVDQDFNGKADQYRWLGTAGTRWGLDKDENGEIDSWKTISAEEVTAQVVEAIKRGDTQRFKTILLSPSELKELGLGKQLHDKVQGLIDAAERQFKQAQQSQKITADTKWIDFGALRPGTIPAGTQGARKDVTVYENVVAMVETNGKPVQIPIGTLIQVGDGWRITDVPLVDGDKSTHFVFFEAAAPQSPEAVSGDLSAETQRLVESLQSIDQQLANAGSPTAISKLNAQRADTLEQLAKAATREEDREMWWMQFADTVGASAQTGAYPAGTQRLLALRKQLEASSQNKDLIAHVAFAHMSAEYAERLQAKGADFSKIQDQWLERLEDFVKLYPDSSDAPEAMLQLALAKEFAGDEKEANRWYTKIVRDFSDSPLAGKAAGAKRRLEAVGKRFTLQGRTVAGKPFDIARLQGNVVLVHYWATWCEPCKQDMELIKKLAQEFQRAKFSVVGVNLDSQPTELNEFFRKERPAGTQLYEKGGLDSRLANEMGIFTLPVMLLVDQRGRIVKRQIHAVELKAEIEKLLK